MTLEKAIEILTNIYLRGYKLKTKDDYDSIHLGTEALKAIKHTRIVTNNAEWRILPGETKE